MHWLIVIFKLRSKMDTLNISYDIALRLMPRELSDD